MKPKSLRELTEAMAEELDGREDSYFCTIRDEHMAVAEWDFDDIRRSVLVETSATHKALIGVYLQKKYPSGAIGEFTEEAYHIDTRNFTDNFRQAYKNANEYDEEDLEINQAQRF